MTVKKTFSLMVVIFVITLTACMQETSINPTIQAKIEEFSQTATVRATAANQAHEQAETAQANATATALAVETTRQILATQQDVFVQATQSAAGPVLAELPLYGVDPETGKIVWLHPPVTLRAEGIHGSNFANEYPQITVADFVLAADITWDSLYGNAGCGFLFRSDGDPDVGNHYMLLASRGAQGHVYFFALANGEPVNFKNIYANGLDPNFEWESGSSNRLTVVARGDILEVYSNYTYIGKIDTSLPPEQRPDLPPPPARPQKPDGQVSEAIQTRYEDELVIYQARLEAYQNYVNDLEEQYAAAVRGFSQSETHFEEGFVGLLSLTYNGWAECTFENTWLWAIED